MKREDGKIRVIQRRAFYCEVKSSTAGIFSGFLECFNFGAFFEVALQYENKKNVFRAGKIT